MKTKILALLVLVVVVCLNSCSFADEIPPAPPGYTEYSGDRPDLVEKIRMTAVLNDRQARLMDASVVKAFRQQIRRMLRMEPGIRAAAIRTGITDADGDIELAPAFLQELLSFYHQQCSEEARAIAEAAGKYNEPRSIPTRDVEFAVFYSLVLKQFSLKLVADPASEITNKKRVYGSDELDNEYFLKSCLEFVKRYTYNPVVIKYVLSWMAVVPHAKPHLTALLNFYATEGENDERASEIAGFIRECELVNTMITIEKRPDTKEIVKTLLERGQEGQFIQQCLVARVINNDDIKVICKSIIKEFQAKQTPSAEEIKSMQYCKNKVEAVHLYPEVMKDYGITDSFFGF